MQLRARGHGRPERPFILHVLPSFAPSRLFLSTIDPIKADYAVAALDGDGPLLDDLRTRGVPGYAISAPRSLMSSRRELHRLIQSLKPDAVEFHMFRPSLVGATLAGGMRARPRFVSVRHHNLEHHLMRSKRGVAADKWIGRLTDRTIAVSEAVRRTVIAEGIPHNKVVTVTNALECGDFLTPRQSVSPEKRLPVPRIVAVGRLHWIKDYPLMLKVLARLQADGLFMHLRVLGNGPPEYKEELKRQAEHLRIDHQIEWLGHEDDVIPHLSSSDLLLHTSIDESFGLALLEAMLVGLPIVAAASGGSDEVLSGFYQPVRQRRVDVLADRVRDDLREIVALNERAQSIRHLVLRRFNHLAQIDGHIETCIG